RRWIVSANPKLSALITEKIGPDWVKHCDQLKKLEAYADDEDVLNRLIEIKRENKIRFAKEYVPFEVSEDMLF
ncbi:glycogen/starch/alpha-glucan phosphorylase, partial [Klebsiella pneumoniae]|nr:glycogen/starch/alpha-glucan phosphorylase [Klebsiella pneumoniae]